MENIDHRDVVTRQSDLDFKTSTSNIISNDDCNDTANVEVSTFERESSCSQDHVDLTSTSIQLDAPNISKLLVLYTGGTIGMKVKNGVYSPASNYLIGKLHQLPMFNDPEFAPVHPIPANAPLCMPISKQGRRVVYEIIEYNPLLDSCNISIADYKQVAKDVQDNYSDYDGFVILHGTDTMAYTAAALSFMFENLGKPVIITGSQIPIFEARSDGRDNFLGALIMAGHYCIPEVCIYFHNKLFRGNRSAKVDSSSLFAFNSCNIDPLAELGIGIKVRWDAVCMTRGLEKFAVHFNMSDNVGLLRLFPSISATIIRQFLQPPMEGVVLQTYGAGNGPDGRQDIMNELKEASQRGVLILNTTQCSRGTVSASYATGKALVDCGIFPGGDMTSEAALMKLSYILGKHEWSMEVKRQKLVENLRGEVTVTKMPVSESTGDYSLLDKLMHMMQLTSSSEIMNLKTMIFPSMMCLAAKTNKKEALRKLLLAGAVLGQSDYDGRTALHIAAAEGNAEVVKFLIEEGAAVHHRDRYGNSALCDAVHFKRMDIIKLLIETGAHLHLSPCKIGMNLYHAVMQEGIEAIKAWLEAGASVNQGDYDDRRPLHAAAVLGDPSIVEFLLSVKADPSLKDRFDRTAMDEARFFGNIDVIMLLQSE